LKLKPIKLTNALLLNLQSSIKYRTVGLSHGRTIELPYLDEGFFTLSDEDALILAMKTNNYRSQPYTLINSVPVYQPNGEFYDNIPIRYKLVDEDDITVFVEKGHIVITLPRAAYEIYEDTSNLPSQFLNIFILPESTRSNIIYGFKNLISLYNTPHKPEEFIRDINSFYSHIGSDSTIRKEDKVTIIKLCKIALSYYIINKTTEKKIMVKSDIKNEK